MVHSLALHNTSIPAEVVVFQHNIPQGVMRKHNLHRLSNFLTRAIIQKGGMVQTQVTTFDREFCRERTPWRSSPNVAYTRNPMARRTRNGTESVPYRTAAGLLP